MNEAELLTMIPAPQPNTEYRESEAESDDDDDDDDDDGDEEKEEEEDDNVEVKITLQNSIMKMDEGSESDDEEIDTHLIINKEEHERKGAVVSDEDEGIEEGSNENDVSEEHSDQERTSGVPLSSRDDLEANFIIEKIEGSSESENEEILSGDEQEEDQDSGKKRKGFSVDQLQLETKKKGNKRTKVSRGKGKEGEVHEMKNRSKIQRNSFSKKEQQKKKGGKKGKKKKRVTN